MQHWACLWLPVNPVRVTRSEHARPSSIAHTLCIAEHAERAGHCNADPLNPLSRHKDVRQQAPQQNDANEAALGDGGSLQLLAGFLAKAVALVVFLYIDANISLPLALEYILQCMALSPHGTCILEN